MMFLWLIMIAGELIVAFLALRECRNKYPCFTTLVCFMAAKSVFLFAIREYHPESYFYAYYRTEFAANVLHLGASVEVFGCLFRPFWTVPKNSLATLGMSTALAIVVVTRANIILADVGEIAFYRSLARVCSCGVAIAIAAALLFASHFEMPFRSRVQGIACGLFLMSVTDVLMALVLSQNNIVLSNSVAFVPVVAHYAILTIWIYYVARKEALTAVLDRGELNSIQQMLNQFALALCNTPTDCGFALRKYDLTARKKMGKAVGERKAKVVNHNG